MNTKLTPIAICVLAAVSTYVQPAVSGYAHKVISSDTTLTSFSGTVNKTEQAEDWFGLFVQKANGTITGNTDVSVKTNTMATGIFVTSFGTQTSSLNIGSSDVPVDHITVNAVSTGNKDATGIWVTPNISGNSNYGAFMNVHAKNVNVNAEVGEGDNNYAVGIIVMNMSTNSTHPVSQMTIDADNIVITAKAHGNKLAVDDKDNRAVGIQNISQGILELKGNVYVTADTVLSTRGDAQTYINKDGNTNKIVQLKGDIDFNFNAQTSGTKIDAIVDIKLTNKDSFIEGNFYRTGYPIPEGKADVNGFVLGLSNGAYWTSTEDSFVNQINLDNGVVNVNLNDKGEAHSIKSNIAGTGGTINLASHVDQKTGAITTGKAEFFAAPKAATKLNVNFPGVTTDDVGAPAETLKKLMANVTVANSDGGDANDTGVIATGTLAEGDIRGAYTESFTADGQSVKDSAHQDSNTKLDDFKGANAIAMIQWRNEINHLTKRLGDIRADQSTYGAWARVYGSKSEWTNSSVTMDSTSVQVGGDTRLGDWYVGGAFGYVNSSYDLLNGDGSGDAYTLAAYATKLFESGLYTDVVARYGYLKNDIRAANMNLTTKQQAFGLSGEVGWHFTVAERGYFEPQFELSYGYVAGDDETASNGVRIDQDAYQNLITRLGGRVGFDFPREAGTFYAQASYNYDFLGKAESTASKDGLQEKLSEDLGGGWFSYGIGAQFKLGDNLKTYLELERTNGGEVKNPWLFNIGARYVF